jgi:hypothetical protein
MDVAIWHLWWKRVDAGDLRRLLIEVGRSTFGALPRRPKNTDGGQRGAHPTRWRLIASCARHRLPRLPSKDCRVCSPVHGVMPTPYSGVAMEQLVAGIASLIVGSIALVQLVVRHWNWHPWSWAARRPRVWRFVVADTLAPAANTAESSHRTALRVLGAVGLLVLGVTLILTR